MARQAETVAGAEEEKLAQAVRQIQALAESDVPGVMETWRGVAMVVSVLAMRKGKREQSPHGTAVAGFWISAVMLTIVVIAALIVAPW